MANGIDKRHLELAAVVSRRRQGPHRTIAEAQEAVDLITMYADHMGRTRRRVPPRQLRGGERKTDAPAAVRRVRGDAPFNFPAALAVNMTAAASSQGNSVVLKPSEEMPWTGGSILAEIAASAGLPRES